MPAAKKDTDKDLLFSKILPALNDNPFSPTYQGAPAGQPPAPADEEDALSALRNKLQLVKDVSGENVAEMQ